MLKALAKDERKTIGLVKSRIIGWKIEGRGTIGAVRRIKSARWDWIAATLRSRRCKVWDSRTKYISMPVTATMMVAR